MPIAQTDLSVGAQAGDVAPTQTNIAGNMSAGLKTGMQLASVQDQLESQKMQVQQQKMDLMQKQATAMINRTQAALFSPNQAQFDKIMAGNKAYAQQAQIPYDDEAIAALYKDPATRLGAQKAISLASKGQVPPDEALSMLSSAPDMFAHVNSLIGSNAAIQNKNAQETKIEGMKVQGELGKASIMATAATGRLDSRNQAIYDRILKGADAEIKPRITQVQNLQNAISNIESGQSPTPEAFNELQQAVRANLGIKAGGGVDERAKTMMNSMGLKAADVMQFLSGKPQDVTNYGGTDFMEHIKALAENEISNATMQAQAAVNKHMVANNSFFAAHPNLRADVSNYAQSALGQFKVNQPTAQTPAASPQAPAALAPQDAAIVQDFMQQHGLSPDKQAAAIQALKKAGKIK